MYLIWTIINSAFIVVFAALVLALIFKGKEIFNNKYGNLILIFLAIGFLGILNKDSYNPKNEYEFPIPGEELVGRTVKSTRIVIEDNLTFDINFTVRFRQNTLGELIPTFSRSNTTGFTNGFVWNYTYADIEKIDVNNFKYTITGILDWNLFSIRIYSQDKEFTGTFSLNQQTAEN